MSGGVTILTINPGSTSTKIAVFENTTKAFSLDVVHDAATLDSFPGVLDQLEYRKKMILGALEAQGYSLEDFDAFSGRGGGMDPCTGGTYEVTPVVIASARKNSFHPAALGTILAHQFAQRAGVKAFMVNPPDVDEFQPVARVTGLQGVYRESRLHALSHKEVGKLAAKRLGRAYEETNLIIAHIGGGISVAAHRAGRIVDADDLMNSDCPMAPTRVGHLSMGKVVELCFSGEYTKKELKALMHKSGGFVSHFGTSDALEIEQRMEAGDSKAELVFNGMVYQIGKRIGAFSAVLHGKVDAIVLTGGIARSEILVRGLKSMVGHIADFIVIPGELEMEALAAGAYRVLVGEEEPKVYTGEPVWKGYDDYAGDENGV